MASPDASLDDEKDLALGTLEEGVEECWEDAEPPEPIVEGPKEKAKSGTSEESLEE